MRAALADLRAGMEEIGRKVDHLAEIRAVCVADCTRGITDAAASAKAAHHRIDEVRDEARAGKANRAALWIGVVLAVIGSLVSGALTMIFGRRS